MGLANLIFFCGKCKFKVFAKKIEYFTLQFTRTDVNLLISETCLPHINNYLQFKVNSGKIKIVCDFDHMLLCLSSTCG